MKIGGDRRSKTRTRNVFVSLKGKELERVVREWRKVYEGLSEEDIIEVERIALESRQIKDR